MVNKLLKAGYFLGGGVGPFDSHAWISHSRENPSNFPFFGAHPAALNEEG